MTENTGRIHDAPAGGGYLARSVLDASTLETIRETNTGFLTLVAQRRASRPGAAAFGLSAAAVAGIATLGAAGLRAAASCPYTLFNLRFRDAAFWSGVARESSRDGSGSLSDEATFARTAVFLAWHLARRAELTPAVVLGMTPAVRQAWRALPLSAIDHAATAALPHLAARWGDHPLFWPKLIDAPQPDDRARRHSVRLLGLQLLAAEGIRADPPRAEARPVKW
jgi:hypothetical protein